MALSAIVHHVKTDVNEANVLQAVSLTRGKRHGKAYALTLKTLKHNDLAAYASFVKLCAAYATIHPGHRDGIRECCQKKTGLVEIYMDARFVRPVFVSAVDRIQRTTSSPAEGAPGPESIVLKVGPLKHLYRAQEKVTLDPRSADTGNADGVCDFVRCIFSCKGCAEMEAVLRAVLECTALTVVRVKDRMNESTSMGWADVMINVTLNGDEKAHVCEIQIANKAMLALRDKNFGLNAHHEYAQARSAKEILGLVEAHAAASATISY